MFRTALQRKISIIVNMDSSEVSRHSDFIKRKMEGLKRAGMMAFKAIAIGAGIAAVGMGIFAKGVIATGMEFEKFNVQLKVLYGSVEQAKAQFDWIKDFATTTPFELPQVVEATVMLKAFGLQAQEVLKDIGDLSAGMQQPLDFVVDAFGRLAAGQTGEAFEKFRRLGITVTKLAAEGIKFSSGNQLLSAPMEALAAIQRIIRRDFPDMMQEQAKTTAGIFTNIKDTWTQFLGYVADGFLPVLKRELTAIKDWGFEMLQSGQLEAYASTVAGKMVDVFETVRRFIPKMVKAAMEFWDTIKTPFMLFIDNPSLITNAAILIVLGKMISLAKTFYEIIKSSIILLGKSSLAKYVSRLVSARVATTAMAAAVPAGATTAMAATAGAGAIGLSTIVPIVVGVLAAAAVGYGIYKLVQNMRKGFDEKYESHKERVQKLELSLNKQDDLNKLRGMSSELSTLAQKTSLTADEQSRYNKLIQDVGELAPDAVTHYDEYGKAIGIATGKINEMARAQDVLVNAQLRMIRASQKDVLKEAFEDISSVRAMPAATIKLDVYRAPNVDRQLAQLQGEEEKARDRIFSLEEDIKDMYALHADATFSARAAWVMANRDLPEEPYNKVTQMRKEIKALEEQVRSINSQQFAPENWLAQFRSSQDDFSKISEALSSFYDMSNAKDVEELSQRIEKALRSGYRDMGMREKALADYVKAGTKEWLERIRVLQKVIKATEDAGGKGGVTSGPSQEEIISSERLALYTKKLTGDFTKYQESEFKTRISTQDKYEQERLSMERKYASMRLDVQADTQILGDVPKEMLKQQEELKKRMVSEGITPVLTAQLDELREKMKQASASYQSAMAEIDRAERTGKAGVDLKESYDRRIEREKNYNNERGNLASHRAEMDQQALEISIMHEDATNQRRIQITHETNAEILRIHALVQEGKLSLLKGYLLEAEIIEQGYRERELAALMAFSTLQAELEQLAQSEKLNGWRSENDQRITVLGELQTLRENMRMEDFANEEAYKMAMLRLDQTIAKEQEKVVTKSMKAKQKLYLAGLSIMLKASKIWAAQDIKLHEAVKMATLQFISDQVSYELEQKGMAAMKEAAIAAAQGNFAKAAALSAAGLAAGAAAGWVRSQADAELERMRKEDNIEDKYGLDDVGSFDNDTGSSRVASAYSTRGIQNLYLQPSITITGDTVIVGDTGLEVAAETIGDIAMQRMQEALDTGQLSIPG